MPLPASKPGSSGHPSPAWAPPALVLPGSLCPAYPGDRGASESPLTAAPHTQVLCAPCLQISEGFKETFPCESKLTGASSKPWLPHTLEPPVPAGTAPVGHTARLHQCPGCPGQRAPAGSVAKQTFQGQEHCEVLWEFCKWLFCHARQEAPRHLSDSQGLQRWFASSQLPLTCRQGWLVRPQPLLLGPHTAQCPGKGKGN